VYQRAHIDRGDAPVSGRESSGVSAWLFGRPRLERSSTLLPMPRAGTFTTRRKLTSSCGLMSSRR
jgi:hypothetical protein